MFPTVEVRPRASAIHAAHVVSGPIEDRPWGVRAFTACIAGCRFMVASRSET